MTAKLYFKKMMRERREFPRGTPEFEWRTNAAKKYVWLMRGVPVCEWRV